MAGRLLHRQNSLLEYLTSGAAIFGGPGDRSLDRAPFGIDLGLLHLEARYSHEKRLAKIKWVLPRTFDLLGIHQAGIVREFVDTCPPVSIGRLENARQFHDFLLAHWRAEPPEPAYLPDLASFELAHSAVSGDGMREDEALKKAFDAPRGAVRRHPGVVLLRCAHDIRPILEAGACETAALRCDTRFAIAMPPGAADPIVCALSHELFALLELLDDFADPDIFQDTPGAHELVTNLAASGILEVRL
jgi:hypothetical protein